MAEIIRHDTESLNKITDVLNKVNDFIPIHELPNGDKIEFGNLDIELRENLTKLFSINDIWSYLKTIDHIQFIQIFEESIDKFTELITKKSFSTDEKFQHYSKIATSLNESTIETHKKIIEQRSLINEVDNLLQNAEKINKQSIAFKEKILTQKTEEIYSKKSKTYLDYADNFDKGFYLLVSVVVFVSLITLCLYSNKKITFEVFLYLKILIVTVSITMATLFLRKSSHYRKLHHIYEHIHLELTALPIYLYNIPEEQHAEIYKTLVSTYFGNSIDCNQIDKSGDLINEQIKNSIELIKVSSEVTKAAKVSQEK